MITLKEYFGPWLYHADATDERKAAAEAMLAKVNPLLDEMAAAGVKLLKNPHTETLVSGADNGGFRIQSCPIGAAHSSHKEGRAVDLYDPRGELDRWLDDTILEKHDLYREAPVATQGWCHLTDRAPGSGKRTFYP